MEIEVINSLARLEEVLKQWSVWDLTQNGILTMQSLYGDMFDFQLDMSNRQLFIEAVLAYEYDSDMEWRAI